MSIDDNALLEKYKEFRALGTVADKRGRLRRAQHGGWTKWCRENHVDWMHACYVVRRSNRLKPPDSKGVYVIGFPERNEYKIGKTLCGLANRLGGKTFWAYDPSYQKFWNCESPRKVEQAAHKLFSANRINPKREWFTFTAEELKRVENTLTLLSA